MKNKKLLLVSIGVILALVAAACGGGEEATPAPTSTTIPVVEENENQPGGVKTLAQLIVLGTGPAGVAGSRFTDPDVEINLTAEVVQWEVVAGEIVEVWGYNGQYPGPEIRVTEGDKVRINFTNNLPEATTIHWHGLEVPNDQDGVPGVTQPDIPSGDSWTYEFVAPNVGTMMYHTHSNTNEQLRKGLFGAFIVEPREEGTQYDREYVLLLHEIEGLYTINGHSFPKTLETDLLKIKSDERALIRLINAGNLHHPLHLHGHQFKVLSIDGNDLPFSAFQNTVDMAPGQTVDVEIVGTNPGTWLFHCHVIPHVTNRGVYPGGMLLVLDYEDHTSYFDEQAAAAGGDANNAASSVVEEECCPGLAHVDGAVEIVTTEFAFSLPNFSIQAGEPVMISLRNVGALTHNLVVEGLEFKVEAEAAQTETKQLVISEPGTYRILCDIPGHAEAGMTGTIVVEE